MEGIQIKDELPLPNPDANVLLRYTKSVKALLPGIISTERWVCLYIENLLRLDYQRETTFWLF